MPERAISKPLLLSACLALAVPVATPASAADDGAGEHAGANGGSCTVGAPLAGSRSCAWHDSEPGEKVSVSASGLFIIATATCGGASATCSSG